MALLFTEGLFIGLILIFLCLKEMEREMGKGWNSQNGHNICGLLSSPSMGVVRGAPKQLQ